MARGDEVCDFIKALRMPRSQHHYRRWELTLDLLECVQQNFFFTFSGATANYYRRVFGDGRAQLFRQLCCRVRTNIEFQVAADPDSLCWRADGAQPFCIRCCLCE